MGAAIGFDPETVGRLSLWKFFAAVEGYVKANSPEEAGLTSDEESRLFKKVQEHRSARKA